MEETSGAGVVVGMDVKKMPPCRGGEVLARPGASPAAECGSTRPEHHRVRQSCSRVLEVRNLPRPPGSRVSPRRAIWGRGHLRLTWVSGS